MTALPYVMLAVGAAGIVCAVAWCVGLIGETPPSCARLDRQEHHSDRHT